MIYKKEGVYQMEILKNKVKYYEIEFGRKFNEKSESPYETDDGIPIVYGMIGTEYSIAIKADHYPTLQEAENFCKEDIEKFGYDGVYGITPLTEQEVHSFFDDSNIDNWKILSK